MCTIALGTRLSEGTPLVVGANREERWDRPSRPPALIEANPRVLAPFDLEADGTWIGINEDGLFLAITNRPGDLDGQRSRGLLVRDLLRCGSLAAATTYVDDALERDRYAGFNLVLATNREARVCEWDGDTQWSRFPPGLHVIVNQGVNDGVLKASITRARLQTSSVLSIEQLIERLPVVLADHGNGTCLHEAERGSRSSSIIQHTAEGQVTWSYADGPPCETSYRVVFEGEL